MALAKKCDRCGDLYEHYPIGSPTGSYNAIRRVRRGLNGTVEYDGKPMDMCPDCMVIFEKFIKDFEIAEVE